MLPRRLLPVLARLVLAWFALHVGIGVAAPVLHPQASLEAICTGGMMKLLPGSGDDAAGAKLASIDCPLCSPAIAPPPVIALPSVPPAGPMPLLVQEVATVTPHALAPPPARGPPASIQA